MQREILLHSMISSPLDEKQTARLKEKLHSEAVRSQVSGCFLIHESECVYYLSGSQAMIDSMMDEFKKALNLSKTEILHEGDRMDECLGLWDFIAYGYPSLSDLEIDIFKQRLVMAREASIGLKLFSSISEIILTENSYTLE